MYKLLLGGTAAALTLAAASGAQAANFTPADCAPNNIHFCVSGDAQAPGVDDYITAVITNTFTSPTSIDDSFFFRIDKNGVGSGGLNTTFSSLNTLITITDVIINGISYASQIDNSGAGSSLEVNGIPIVSGADNYIRIIGSFAPPAGVGRGTYTGNLTFTAAIPEVGTWAMMMLGIGVIGGAMRRRKYGATRARVQYA